jgi:CRISPR-associated protein Cas1
MKKLLNTLFVMTQGAYLCREGESVLVRIEKETRLRMPVHTLSGIVCFGQVSCSPPLMGLCAERGAAISFMTEHGRFLARVVGPVSGNVLLRREQFRLADDSQRSGPIAQAVVAGKIANCRTVLQRAARDHADNPGNDVIKTTVNRLSHLIRELNTPLPLETLRAREGEAASAYFSSFDHLITAQKDDFFFHERNRRPPMDNMNALLSFMYTLLAHDVSSSLQSVGLDPQVGFLHADRPGRPGLALDLMEEFRPFLADRLALSLVNLRQVQADGFVKTESGAINMDDETRKTVLVSYQKRKQEKITHPFLNETVEIGLLPYAQALLLARHLRGDLDAYPPFIWR